MYQGYLYKLNLENQESLDEVFIWPFSLENIKMSFPNQLWSMLRELHRNSGESL